MPARRLTHYSDRLSANDTIKFKLGTSLARRLAAYMGVQGHTDLEYAIKELVSIGLSATPEDGVRYLAMSDDLNKLKQRWIAEAYAFVTMKGKALEEEFVKRGATREELAAFVANQNLTGG